MKRLINYFLLFFLFGSLTETLHVEKAAAQGGEVSFQIFYDRLSPYGHWVDFPEEGYVWIPETGTDFSPYSTNGYWVYTDYGWTWVSNYSWGWAPFHYGRWDFDDDYGWYWVPEYEWAPAWVAWSSCPGYYGWAPLRPGIEVNAAITGGYYVPPEHWHYVHEEYLGQRDMARHFAPQSENATHIRNSTMINHTYIDNARHTTYIGGPPREEVEKSTKAPVQQLKIVPRSTPGQSITKNQVSIYRPVVAKTTTTNPNPAPARISDLKVIKPLPGRTPSPERLSNAPSAPTQQVEPNRNPTNVTPPARSNERVTPPEPNRIPANAAPPARQNDQAIPPEPKQQPAPQQTAPRVTTPPQNVPQVNRNTAPVQQRPAPVRDRPNRYAPPQYQAPKPNLPVQQHPAPAPRVTAPRQAAPQRMAPQSRPGPSPGGQGHGKPH